VRPPDIAVVQPSVRAALEHQRPVVAQDGVGAVGERLARRDLSGVAVGEPVGVGDDVPRARPAHRPAVDHGGVGRRQGRAGYQRLGEHRAHGRGQRHLDDGQRIGRLARRTPGEAPAHQPVDAHT
jgi:hypothetical protein